MSICRILIKLLYQETYTYLVLWNLAILLIESRPGGESINFPHFFPSLYLISTPPSWRQVVRLPFLCANGFTDNGEKVERIFLIGIFEAILNQMFSGGGLVMMGVFVRVFFPWLSKLKERDIITNPANDVEVHNSVKEKKLNNYVIVS